MSDKDRGLYQKYNVRRVDGKPIGDCIVLELDDPNTWDALLTFATTLQYAGYHNLSKDIRDKVIGRWDCD